MITIVAMLVILIGSVVIPSMLFFAATEELKQQKKAYVNFSIAVVLWVTASIYIFGFW